MSVREGRCGEIASGKRTFKPSLTRIALVSSNDSDSATCDILMMTIRDKEIANDSEVTK